MTAPIDHERLREELGGYVLGGLTVAEQQAVERHLAECAACRAELAELDPVPVLLDLAAEPASATDLTDASTGPVPAPAASTAAAPRRDTGDAPRDELAGRRSRRRRFGALAAAVAGVAAAFLIGFVVATPSETTYGTAHALHPVASASASGTVAVRKVSHGVEVRLVVKDLPAGKGTWYECVWWSGGDARSAGSFTSPGAGSHTIDLTTAADLHSGWRLAILEHADGAAKGVPVLQTSS
jgi:anti-sigma factor RsiW